MFISYDYYKAFYYVAKYKNFTQAANVLLRNQPNVTRTVKLLEAALGCTLFVRSNRGVVLTAEGEKLYEYVSPAVELLQKGEEALRLCKDLQDGIVSVGTTETALYECLLPILRQYREQYPKIKVHVTNQSTPQAIRSVKNGLVDFAVVTTPTALNGALQVQKVREFSEILVGGRKFEFLKENPLRIEELKKYPFISLSRDTATYAFYDRLFAEKGILLAPDMEAATVNQLMMMVKENLGIGFLPEAFARRAVQSGELVPLSLAETVPSRSICIVEGEERRLNTAADTLKRMLLK